MNKNIKRILGTIILTSPFWILGIIAICMGSWFGATLSFGILGIGLTTFFGIKLLID